MSFGHPCTPWKRGCDEGVTPRCSQSAGGEQRSVLPLGRWQLAPKSTDTLLAEQKEHSVIEAGGLNEAREWLQNTPLANRARQGQADPSHRLLQPLATPVVPGPAQHPSCWLLAEAGKETVVLLVWPHPSQIRFC